MTPETLEWLSIKVSGFAKLTEDELDAIDDFSFLWNLFEGKIMNRRCDLPLIRNYVQQLEERGGLEILEVEWYVRYLRNRYLKDGDVTDYYYGLNLGVHNNTKEVLETLRNEDASKLVKVIGCLIVIYRLRNNLFHGEKWQYHLQDQLTNFVQENEFIKQHIQLDVQGY
ncbi:MAG: hypothetical protein H6510_06165 [Acidobacteria bacterium]|nr:hypothetical protein [Acidobacteriota bacterium]